MQRLYGIQEVRVLGDRGLVASHTFATPVSLAACWEGSIAVAQGSSVHMLAVDSSAGQLQPGMRSEYSQQVAAVAIVELADTSNKVKAFLEDMTRVLAVAQWVPMHWRRWPVLPPPTLPSFAHHNDSRAIAGEPVVVFW